MAQEIRQNNLFAAEDFQAIYASFANSNFKVYDYDTIRSAMVSYIQKNYPEDFNDWIESSEFVAIIDLVAFLGHNLAFRNDLNTRENFLDTAERRESVLRLARMLSFNPKRNATSEGQAKIVSIKTNEPVFDSNQTNLQNQEIVWGDNVNPDAYEQFIKIINSAFSTTNQFGTPTDSAVVNNMQIQRYTLNTPALQDITYSTGVNLNTVQTQVEFVGAELTTEGTVYESTPNPTAKLSLLYKNDGAGLNSVGTGFFMLFKEGQLNFQDTNISDPIENQVIDINASDVNETDVWVQNITEAGTVEKFWTKVENTVGNNVAFNSITNNIRDIFAVITGDNDSISIKFADGSFGNAPKDIIRTWYRTSANKTVVIRPNDLQNKVLKIPYVGVDGRDYVLSVTVSLQETVATSSPSQTVSEIKQYAPEVYATQNRMVTAQDYTVYPYTTKSGIKKIKSINRTHSGHSRYIDINDPTGNYKDLNLFTDDAYIYKRDSQKRDTLALPTTKTTQGIIDTEIATKIRDAETISFYYDNYTPVTVANSTTIKWQSVNIVAGRETGYIVDGSGNVQKVGPAGVDEYKYVREGAVIEWQTPTGDLVFSAVDNVDGSGLGVDNASGTSSGLTQVGNGTVSLKKIVPANSTAKRIWPAYNIRFNTSENQAILDKLNQKVDFAIRYDYLNNRWMIVDGDDVSVGGWSYANSGDKSSANLDASWLVRINFNNQQFVFQNRVLRTYISSEANIRFFNERYKFELDEETLKPDRDEFKFLEVNSKPNSSQPLGEIITYKTEAYHTFDDGYTDPRRVIVTNVDPDLDYIPEDPTAFEKITGNGTIKLKIVTERGFEFEELAGTNDSSTFNATGRSGLRMQWKHYSPDDHRIDPAVINIIDTFVMTENYDTNFRNWLATDGTIANKPLAPTSETLRQTFADLENVKTSSDTIIYHPGKYKVLFGDEADSEVRAKFKVVKNQGTRLTDNEIKAKVVQAIEEFFEIENWDFGETFYYTELATYVHNQNLGDISSVVIVPQNDSSRFGNLFQITPDSDELFISSAKVTDVQIISQITANNIRVTGASSSAAVAGSLNGTGVSSYSSNSGGGSNGGN